MSRAVTALTSMTAFSVTNITFVLHDPIACRACKLLRDCHHSVSICSSAFLSLVHHTFLPHHSMIEGLTDTPDKRWWRPLGGASEEPRGGQPICLFG